jgi:hypothetical protein
MLIRGVIRVHDLCTAPNITGVIESRMTRWAVRVSRMGKARKPGDVIGSKTRRKESIWKTYT